jgi:tetratricopeptide (TPR) repeat protein/transcriptional regulator with XRE-family HTH domain
VAERAAETFGELLRRLRAGRDLPLEALARSAGLSERTLEDLEAGRTNPHPRTLRRLADALGLTGNERDRLLLGAPGSEPAPGNAGTPRAATSPEPARELPRDTEFFSGRGSELARILHAAGTGSGTIAITGMAGVGKSALAVHAAHILADRFPDGQVFISLGGFDPGAPAHDTRQALAVLLLAAGVDPRRIPESVQQRAALWRGQLAGRRMLIVLDGAAGQVEPLLPGSPDSLVIVTSRSGMTAAAIRDVIRLDALPPDEAALLLATIAGRPGLDPADPALAEIAELCGGLPLAIQIAAAFLSLHPSWTPRDLASDLRGSRSRLSLLDAGGVSVSSAIGLSVQALSAEQRLLYLRLGLHPGPDFDGYAAAALCGRDMASARRLLRGLEGASLIDEQAPGRYGFQELVREHARGLAAAEDPADTSGAVKRLLDYYARTAQVADEVMYRHPAGDAPGVTAPAAAPALAGPPDAVAWALAERVNIQAAAAYAAARGLPGHAIAIARAMHSFLLRHGYWDDARTMTLTALQAARDADDRAAEAGALADLGDVERLTGDFAAADGHLTQALGLYRELGHAPGEARATGGIGALELASGRYQEATGSFTRAAGQYRSAGDLQGEASALTRLAAAQQILSDYDSARQSLDRALESYRTLGDRPGEADALLQAGILDGIRGNHAAGIADFTRALTLYAQLNDLPGQANALFVLGDAQLSAADYGPAAESLSMAGELFAQLGEAPAQGPLAARLGDLLLATGRPQEAEDRFRQALTLARKISSLPDEARAAEGVGLSLLQGGQTAQGAGFLAAAADLYQALGLGADAERARDMTRLRQDVPGAGGSARPSDEPGWRAAGPAAEPGGPAIPPPPDPGAGPAGTGGPPRRYLKGQCPDTVAPGEVLSLIVSVVTGGGGATLRPFMVPPGGLPLLLVVHAPGFRMLGPRRQEVSVPVAGDSDPVMFELEAGSPGQRRISVTAWEGGTYLGELPLEIGVRRDKPPHHDQTVHGEIREGHADGDVTLVVRHDQDRNYRFEFRDIDNPAEVQATLAYEPGPAVERLLARLSMLAEDRPGYPPDIARDYLVNAGLEMWEQLIPETLRRQFWERQPRIRQLTILSDADTVPWELLYPKDPGHEEGFLVEQFPVTRAVFGRWPPRTLQLAPARFVLPQGSPPQAATEIEAIHALLRGKPGDEVVTTLAPLLDLIQAGDFGLLHFACHNRFDPADGSAIRLDYPFLPMQLNKAGSDRTLAGRTPLVFINACRSAGQIPSYNRLDGWADKFLRAGAAAFIGSLWAVRDATACEFAKDLYSRLQAGETLGNAAMSARRAAAAQAGDPTWLAYAVYGDPLAKQGAQPTG